MKHTAKSKPILYLIPIVLLAIIFGKAVKGEPQHVYPSGNAFRTLADHVFDEGKKKRFYPERIKKNQIVFVKTDYLDRFFAEHHKKIPAPYVLITHNSDHPAPGPFAHYLEDPKIKVWFAQNVDGYTHPKLHPIPIGIANKKWKHGDVKVFDNVVKRLPKLPKKDLVYLNFKQDTFLEERSIVYDLYATTPYTKKQENLGLQDYLLETAQSKFVLSPRGNGLDCHRTWEALLMGAIPVVKTSPLDPLFEGLPVLIVSDWRQLSQAALEEMYEELRLKPFHCEKLYFPYWKKQILAEAKR